MDLILFGEAAAEGIRHNATLKVIYWVLNKLASFKYNISISVLEINLYFYMLTTDHILFMLDSIMHGFNQFSSLEIHGFVFVSY